MSISSSRSRLSAASAAAQKLEPFARQRPDAITYRRVVIEHAPDKHRAGAEHDHRRQDQLNRAADRFGAHEPSSAVLKTVVKRRQ